MEKNDDLSHYIGEDIQIAGARGEIEDVEALLKIANSVAKETDSIIQLLDARAVFGERHILSAVHHAKRAWAQGRRTAGDIGLEILLYSAGDIQIQRAIKKVGIKDGQGAIALVVLGETQIDHVLDKLGLKRDDSVLMGDETILDILGIEKIEREGRLPEKLQELVLEKVALVDLLK